MAVVTFSPEMFSRQNSYGPPLVLENLMLEGIGGDGDAYELRPRPTITTKSTPVTAAVGRGMIARPGLIGGAWCVIGNKLYQLNASDALIDRGTLTSSTSPVSFAGDETTLVIVDGPNAYIWNGTALAAISDPDLPDVIDCDIINQRVLFVEQNSGRFWWSEVLDYDDIEAINFATAESGPDNLRSVTVVGSDIYLAGLDTIEIWYNSTDPDAPFQRQPGGVLPKGTMGTHSVCVADGAYWFVSSEADRRVYRADRLAAQRISNDALEQILAQVEDTSAVTMWAQQWQGHEFVLVDVPTVGTYAYDIVGGYWSRWRSGTDENWSARFSGYFDNTHLCLGRADGQMYGLSEVDFGDIDGTNTYKASFYLSKKGRASRVDSIALRGRMGVGVDEESNPQITLYYSDDAGRNWSTGLARGLGVAGDTDALAIWRRLGRLKRPGKLFRLEWSSAFGPAISSVEVNEF